MPRKILLADDSPTIRRLVTQTFADANFRIVEVNNGDAAIKTFEESRPDIVLADIYMPGKNGYQVCTHIRNHPELSQTPVILLVGAFDAFDEDAAKHAGATASITKPFEPGALIELVTSVLPRESGPPEPEPALPETSLEPVREHVSASETVEAADGAPATEETTGNGQEEDLLGLSIIFREESPPAAQGIMTEEDIDRIADRVIQRVSTQVI